MAERHTHLNPAADSSQPSQIVDEIKHLAQAGAIPQAIMLYRQTHNVGAREAMDRIRELTGLPSVPEKIGSVPLSAETISRLEILFSPRDRSEAARLLVEKCGDNLPGYEKAAPQVLDRLRFAALKLSEGSLLRLREAIQLANIDWRDLLVAAGFGNDPRIHEGWLPKPHA